MNDQQPRIPVSTPEPGRRVRLTNDELVLVGACLVSSQRQLQEKSALLGPVERNEAAEIVQFLDTIGFKISHDVALNQYEATLVASCLENVRRLVRKDAAIPPGQRAEVQRQCMKLIKIFDGS